MWLSLGVLFSASTQLRLGRPVGPGELMLVIWMIKEWWLNRSTPLREYLLGNAFGEFWLVSWVTMLLGWVYAISIGVASSMALRDLVSYLFVGAFTITFAASAALRHYRILVYWSLVLTSGLYGLLLALSLRGPFLGPFRLFTFRFTGLTDNPNQVALLVCVAPIFLVLCWPALGTRLAKFLAVISIVVAAAVGRACSSDAWLLSWVFIAGAAVILLFRPLAELWVGLSMSARRASWAVALGCFALIGTVAYFSLPPETISQIQDSLFRHGGSALDRQILWQNGLFALRDNPIVGLGPGAHSGFSGPYQDQESHSSYIEWATISGVFAVALLIYLFIAPIKRALNNGRIAPALGIGVVIILCLFHYLLRHPVLWFYLALLTASAGPRMARNPQSRRGAARIPEPA